MPEMLPIPEGFDSLNDEIIDMSMNEPNNKGEPPASSETISRLQEIKITKSSQQQCPFASKISKK